MMSSILDGKLELNVKYSLSAGGIYCSIDSKCSVRPVLFNREATSYFITLLVYGYHYTHVGVETMTKGIAIGGALVSYTLVTLDVCDCMQVCDWTHSTMLCAS